MRYTLLGLVALLSAAGSMALAQGGIFVTGHDPDFHADQGANAPGAQSIIQKAFDYTTDGIANNGNAIGSILLVTSRLPPAPGNIDPALGLTASGFATFDMAHAGAPSGNVFDLSTVNFAAYDVVVISSDHGGMLTQAELDILNARSADILTYVNGGGALVAFSESNAGPALTPNGGHFDYLPFLISSTSFQQQEDGNTLTPFGTGLGLTEPDINGNFSHNIFTVTGGMNVVDMNPNGDVLSLAFYGTVGPGGVVPEPGVVALLGAGLLTGSLLVRRRHK
jgi:hypothetical protein